VYATLPDRDFSKSVRMANEFEIDRCICYGVRFADLKQAHDERPRSFEEITAEFGCGSCCGLCKPYIERMLVTGETVFHQVIVQRT
jgi:bacterioferritin-associated ferredoxin